MNRDDKWLASERARLLTWPREKLIGWLQWNDPNGVWTDEDMEAEGWDPMTVEDAVEQVMAFVEENRETPEEMMSGSLKANPDRYPKPAEFDPWLKNAPMPAAKPKAFDVLKQKDPAAAESLRDLLDTEVAFIDFKETKRGYLVTHKDTGESWEYDGSLDMWIEI